MLLFSSSKFVFLPRTPLKNSWRAKSLPWFERRVGVLLTDDWFSNMFVTKICHHFIFQVFLKHLVGWYPHVCFLLNFFCIITPISGSKITCMHFIWILIGIFPPYQLLWSGIMSGVCDSHHHLSPNFTQRDNLIHVFVLLYLRSQNW